MFEESISKQRQQEPQQEDGSTKIALNTAVISTKATRPGAMGVRYQTLSNNPAFTAIASAVLHLSQKTGVSEQEAAQQVILAFRELDAIWDDYVYQEGLAILRKQLKP